eukprot:s2654_g3.t1
MKLACRMLLSVVERTGGSLAIETGKLPTHVVAGKAPALMYSDYQLKRQAGCILPGCKATCFCIRWGLEILQRIGLPLLLLWGLLALGSHFGPKVDQGSYPFDSLNGAGIVEASQRLHIRALKLQLAASGCCRSRASGSCSCSVDEEDLPTCSW